MEKGTKAFVSYIRGYKEHHCKYVFQLADLSIEHVGYMFGLLRLPVMKEVCARICLLPMNNCVTVIHESAVKQAAGFSCPTSLYLSVQRRFIHVANDLRIGALYMCLDSSMQSLR
jgi:hypothetical protein